MATREQLPDNPINAQRNRDVVFTHPRFVLVALAGLLALALSACGTDDASSAVAESDTDGPTVIIEDMAFAPETLTVEAGDTVTWVWNDGSIDHDVAGEGFKSEVMSDGTFRRRFDEPGTHNYACNVHPHMTGTIEVTG